MRTNRVQIVSNCQDDSFQHLRDLLQKNGYEVDEVCSKAETPGETTSIFFQQTQDDSLKERQGQVLALAHFPEANPNPVLCFDAQGIMLYANPAGKSLLQQWGGEIPDDFKQFCLTALTDVEKKTIEVHVAQDIYCFDIVPLAESGCIHVYGRDITHRKRAEFERETAIEFLRLVNESTSTPDLIHRAVEFFQKCSGCDAVGIRLREGEDYPYYETHGFPADFVRLETHLCARDIAGQLMRDEIGHPIIECMCGNVICERTDPSKPFFTTNGSFWSNCTTELLASTTDADRQTHTRNRCNGQGYESVALLPLRFGKEHLGLLQLNNHQRDTFSAPSIALWERLADYLAVALSQSYARDALHASEDTYRSLFDNMLNGFAYCQMLFDEQDNPCDFIYISVNSAFETLTGLKNVIGKRVSEVIPRLKTDDRELFNLYGKVAREGQPERIEVFVEAMQMWFSISVYCPLRGYFVAVFDVITERKKAEEALRQANARLQRFVDANIVGIIVANAEGAIIEANDYYLNLIGFTREELEQKQVSWRTITPPEWLPADELALRELQERGTCTPYEKEYVRRDGTRVPVFLTDALLPGTPEQIIAFALDLTERHRVEEALRVSEIRFRTTFEQAGVGVAVLTPDGRWFQVNQKLCDITGYSAEELLKMQVGDITHPDDLAATQECMRRMQKGEIQSCTVEKRNLRKDGSCVWVSVTVAQVRKTTGEQDYLIAMTEDITARKQAEDAQEKLQLQLSQAQKMESVGRLAGGIAHDFNNILQALMGYGRLLVDTLPRNSESYTYAKEIHTGTQRAATLTRQLLAFSRQQVLEQKSIDINDLVQNLLKMIGRLLGEDVEMIFKPSAKNLHIFADPGQMEQVLMNLCVNARDAMPNGGNLEIEIHDKVLDSSYCAVHPWAKPGAYALLIVSDTGTGMDPATCARIFDPFFTTKELGKGTGLGLATVYGIVKQHDGLIHVYSEIGQGTIFKVYLPLTEETPEEEDMFLPQEIQGGTETILLVEDDEVLRMLACRILEPAGYTVIVASNGEEAAEQMRPAEKEIQLLLSDVLLPKGNGQEVFQVFHQQYPAGRAILMSGYGSTILKDGFWDSAQGAFLQKPFGPQDLLTKIRQVLDAPVPDS